MSELVLSNPSKVSIVVATMHRPLYLQTALESITKQDYKNWECIVIMEYDHEPTKVLLDEFSQLDSRITYFIKPSTAGKGVSNSRNFGLQKTSGRFVQFFDDDDVMLPFHISMKVKLFEDNPQADFVVCKLGGFYNEYKGTCNDPPSYGFEGWINQSNINTFFQQDYKINSCAAMMRKGVFDLVKWDPDVSCEDDLLFYLSLLGNNFIGYETSRVGYHYRQHTNSMTGNFFAGDLQMRESQVLARKKIVKMLAKHQCLTYVVLRSNLILSLKLKRADLKNMLIEVGCQELNDFEWNWLKELNYWFVGKLYSITGKGLRFIRF